MVSLSPTTHGPVRRFLTDFLDFLAISGIWLLLFLILIVFAEG